MELGRPDCFPINTTSAVSRPFRLSVPTLVLGLSLAAWFVVQLPAFLCMGLDNDPNMYDVMARRVLNGDIHYQDLMETNFPGIVWLHMIVRSLFGWSFVAIRGVDVAVVCSIVALLTNWLPLSMPTCGRIGVAAVLLAYYFSTTEWCHCQRDVWMLLPCLIALMLRGRQADRLLHSESGSRLWLWAAAEGVVWASAFWIKPFVAVPGLACWLISAWHASKVPGAARRLAVDLTGFLSGGLLVGGLGVGWLIATGAWNVFLEIMFDWNREYFTHNMCGESKGLALLAFTFRFFPWILVHLVAVPLAIQSLRTRRGAGTIASLQAAFYLAWLIQSFSFQHLFDYVQVPSIFLGIALLSSGAWARKKSLGGWLIVLFLLTCVGWRSISLTVDRVAVWSECVKTGSTPAVRDRVILLHQVHWRELDRVADFLRRQDIRDGELTCFSASTISLYNDLDLRPSTRYLFLEMHLNIFLSRRSLILDSLAKSHQKYLVCDVNQVYTARLGAILDQDSGSNPASALKERVVFRSGDIVVFRLDGSEVEQWLEFLL